MICVGDHYIRVTQMCSNQLEVLIITRHWEFGWNKNLKHQSTIIWLDENAKDQFAVWWCKNDNLKASHWCRPIIVFKSCFYLLEINLGPVLEIRCLSKLGVAKLTQKTRTRPKIKGLDNSYFLNELDGQCPNSTKFNSCISFNLSMLCASPELQ